MTNYICQLGRHFLKRLCSTIVKITSRCFREARGGRFLFFHCVSHCSLDRNHSYKLLKKEESDYHEKDDRETINLVHISCPQIFYTKG